MTDRKIMQQALDALLHMCNTTKAQNDYNAKIVDKALAAIEAALAQPEQAMTPISQDQYERLCFTCGACIGKTWVGLTKGELIDIQNCNRGFWTNAAKIEQLLKDKNT